MLVESFSGIRGIYGTELDLDISEKYAYAYWLSFLKDVGKKKIKIIIGRDSRKSGIEIFQAFCNVLNCEILDLGISPTPVIENAVREFNCDGGIIITASHNEPEYNGFKFLGKNGAVLNVDEIAKVIKKFKELDKEKININTNNQIIKDYNKEALNSYIHFVKKILGNIDLKGIKVLVDPNGGAGICSKKIFEEFGIDANYINMEVGKFERLIEPKLSSLTYLKERIVEQGVEFAAGFDCDADRVEILLKDGKLVEGNEILGIITEEVLSNNPNKPVVVNDATSYLVKDIANKYHSGFIEVEVGETNVVEEMKRVGSLVGGEGSNGGVIVGNSKCRDGILGVLYLLKILSEKK